MNTQLHHHLSPLHLESDYQRMENVTGSRGELKQAKKKRFALLDSNGVDALAHFAEPVQQFPIGSEFGTG